jgi:hypothetical protein
MQVAVAVGVGIDEAGDQDAPFGVDRFRALGRGQSRGGPSSAMLSPRTSTSPGSAVRIAQSKTRPPRITGIGPIPAFVMPAFACGRV